MNKKILIGISILFSLILVGIIIYSIVKLIEYNKNNPVFLKNNHEATEYKKIDKEEIRKYKSDYEFSFHFWMYIGGWFHNRGKLKSILNKGIKAQKNNKPQYLLKKLKSCPGIYLGSNLNNLIITIYEKNNTTEIFRIRDVPLKKWFDIGMTVSYKHLELYFNGKLIKSVRLKNIPNFNNLDMHLCERDGFNGFLRYISYTPKALNAKEMLKKHSSSPYSWFFQEYIDDKSDKNGESCNNN